MDEPNNVVKPTNLPAAAPTEPAVNAGKIIDPTTQPGFEPAKSKRGHKPLPSLVITVLLLALIAGVYLAALHKATQPPAVSPNNATISGGSPTVATSKEQTVPFGKSANDGSYQVKLLSVTRDLNVAGDKPDAGTQYLEADFSITSIADQHN